MPRFAIVEAPSNLGLFPGGVETLPDALIGAGLTERLGARRAGRVTPLPYDDRRDPETKLLNPKGLADYAVSLADAVTTHRRTAVRSFAVSVATETVLVLAVLAAASVLVTSSPGT